MDQGLRESVDKELANPDKTDQEKIAWLREYLFALADQRDGWADLFDGTVEGKAMDAKLRLSIKISKDEPWKVFTLDEVKRKLFGSKEKT